MSLLSMILSSSSVLPRAKPSAGLRFSSFAPLRAVSLSEQEAAHVALRAACGRRPSQRPLAPVQLFSFSAFQYFSISAFSSPSPLKKP
jgi:hypothetical protein